MLGRTDRRLRLILLLVVFMAMSGAAMVRLSYWQVGVAGDLRREASKQLMRSSEVVPIRGEILDRRGTVLATTAYRDMLAAYPDLASGADDDATVAGLATILGLDAAGTDALRGQLAQDVPYVVLERSLTPEQSERIRAQMQVPVGDGGLVGLALESRPVREYPNPGGAPQTTLASQLLGFVTEDGQGRYGIESYYDDVLAGMPTRFASVTAGLLPIPGAMQVTQEGQPGSDIRLTIDASLQLQLEKELYAAWVADRAKRVSAVILDPDTGEVLAWASVPGYDANRYGVVAAETPQLLYDPIASAVYEPGSVMKMVTTAAALESGTVTLEEEVRDSYALRFGTDMVRNSDRSSKGVLPFRDAIAYSRNVATARVALRMDGTVARSSERLHEMWTRFGFGQRTGVDLATEGLGLVSDPSEREWEGIDLANRAFGQGVAVTQIQLAVAYAAMANGGFRVTPHLVQRIGDQEQAVATPSRVIENGLATQLHGLLEHVTSRVPWYRAGTQIPGYVVGGKTGTAQIWDAEGQRWLPDRFNFSFCGFVGADRPEAIIITRIEEAEPTFLGNGILDLGIESYELFRRIAVDTMTALDVPPLPVSDEQGGRPDGGRDPADEPGAGGGGG